MFFKTGVIISGIIIFLCTGSLGFAKEADKPASNTIKTQAEGSKMLTAKDMAAKVSSKKAYKTPKTVFLVGGLAGSGKTTHLKNLIMSLTTYAEKSVKYLDKDTIGKTMPGKTSADIYGAMMEEAAIAVEDVVILEGNIIGNLSLFKEYISAQHELGNAILCLDFQCADAKTQYLRLVEGAKKDPDAAKRDAKKLDWDYYIKTDRPGEIARHDKELALYKDLIDADIIKYIGIESSAVKILSNPMTPSGLSVSLIEQMSALHYKNNKCNTQRPAA